MSACTKNSPEPEEAKDRHRDELNNDTSHHYMSPRSGILVVGARCGGKTTADTLDDDGEEVERDEDDEVDLGTDRRVVCVTLSTPKFDQL